MKKSFDDFEFIKMNFEKSTLENLSDSIQRNIFKYLSLYDRYFSFFSLNRRFLQLVKGSTPEKIDEQQLEDEIHRSAILISDYWVWNDRFSYWIVPQLENDSEKTVRWFFFSTDPTERSIELIDKRILDVVQRFQIQSNSPGLVVSPSNYYFCSLTNDLQRLERWISENYPEQFEIIRTFGVRRRLPKRIDHYDEKYPEIKQVLAEIQRLERFKRKTMIYQQAQRIWTAFRESGDFFISMENRFRDD